MRFEEEHIVLGLALSSWLSLRLYLLFLEEFPVQRTNSQTVGRVRSVEDGARLKTRLISFMQVGPT